MLAWTDSEGVFTRWQSPIPSTAPDPVKTSIITSSIGQTVDRKKSSALFDDDDDDNGNHRHPLEDVDHGLGDMADDDWIVDDLGGGAMTDAPQTRRDAGLVREMGTAMLCPESRMQC